MSLSRSGEVIAARATPPFARPETTFLSFTLQAPLKICLHYHQVEFPSKQLLKFAYIDLCDTLNFGGHITHDLHRCGGVNPGTGP
jgi:hypothetical protein